VAVIEKKKKKKKKKRKLMRVSGLLMIGVKQKVLVVLVARLAV
jgi:hypothetical protein